MLGFTFTPHHERCIINPSDSPLWVYVDRWPVAAVAPHKTMPLDGLDPLRITVALCAVDRFGIIIPGIPQPPTIR